MNSDQLTDIKRRFGIIGNSDGLNRAIDIAVQVAPTDLSVLITGESGVGKENFPKIIHANSARKHGPYIAVNCGAIPEGTIDSELFGHEKGSFTGATTDRKGYFEVADGGTIFLDEVGELPLSTQVRLLRVLETGEFIKVGSSKIQKTNVRVVAATNLDMAQAIQNNRFREDLYYRLNTIPIHVPPLRERKEDIPLLFHKFATDFAEKYRMPRIVLTDDARRLLTNYYWNGNIRQLKNVTEQISIIEHDREITADTLRRYLPDSDNRHTPALMHDAWGSDGQSFASEREILYKVLFDMKQDIATLRQQVDGLSKGQPAGAPTQASVPATVSAVPPATASTPAEITQPVNLVEKAPLIGELADYQEVEEADDASAADMQHSSLMHDRHTMEEMEEMMIRRALKHCKGNRRAAAEELRISQRTLYRKIKEYGITD